MNLNDPDAFPALESCLALKENRLLARPTHGNIVRSAPLLVMIGRRKSRVYFGSRYSGNTFFCLAEKVGYTSKKFGRFREMWRL